VGHACGGPSLLSGADQSFSTSDHSSKADSSRRDDGVVFDPQPGPRWSAIWSGPVLSALHNPLQKAVCGRGVVSVGPDVAGSVAARGWLLYFYPMTRLRSALYVDFDNVFSGLLDLDRKAAFAFAEEPRMWLDGLAETRHGPSTRSFLIRRCYINPAGWRKDGLSEERTYFSKFRPYFTRDGFEVIDCPSLTSRHKNAADIRVCLDILESLSRETRYDEYVIASGDSDFTPLLHRLRAADRQIMLLATTETAVAYRSIADEFMEVHQVIELMLGTYATTGPSPDEYGAGPRQVREPNQAETVSDQPDDLSAAFRQLVEESLKHSSEPLLLAQLGVKVRGKLGDYIERSDWFGAGSLSKAIVSLGIPGVRTRGHYVWIQGVHDEPEDATVISEGLGEPQQRLAEFEAEQPEFVVQLCRVAEVPRLGSTTWPRVFDKLGAYATQEGFNLTSATRWVRDQLAVEGVEVGRGAVGRTIRGATFGGAALTMRPAPTAAQIALAFLSNAVRRAAAVGLTFTDGQLGQLRSWLYPGIPDSALGEIY
jgi:NYN domain